MAKVKGSSKKKSGAKSSRTQKKRGTSKPAAGENTTLKSYGPIGKRK